MAIGDEALAVAAAVHFGLIAPEQWPMAAAYLIAAGFDGPKLVEVASLPGSPSAWAVGPLLPELLAEIHAPDLTDADAAPAVARLLSMATQDDDLLLRALARLARPSGHWAEPLIAAYFALDEVEMGTFPGAMFGATTSGAISDVRALPKLEIESGLAEALCGAAQIGEG